MSKRLDLKDVTLVCVDCVNPSLALRAMRLSMHGCKFAEALLFSSEAVAPAENISVINIPRIRSKREYSLFLTKRLLPHVHSRHVLVIQWDGYVTHPAAWNPAWLEFDYIGAPWPADLSTYPVGNGGFSLRSRKLLEALMSADFPEAEIVHEDQAICVAFRPQLEAKHGIRFAPVDVASRFSHETVQTVQATFGFHGPQNLGMYCDSADLKTIIGEVSRPVLKTPEITWLIRHLHSAGRLDDATRVAAAQLGEQPDNSETLDILATLREQRKPSDYKARSEQRFLLGLVKRQMPDYFRGKKVLEIARPGIAGVAHEWFDQSTIVVPPTRQVPEPGRSGDEPIEGYSAASETFDTVVSCESFEHLPQWRDAFLNALRMMRKDGLLVITCAGFGRKQHETPRCPSPDPAAPQESYYRNLSPADFAPLARFEDHFAEWCFLEDRTVQDLYLLAIGIAAAPDALATFRRMTGDMRFLMDRKHTLGIN